MIFLYLVFVVLANVLTAYINPLTLGVFIIPFGTIFIGVTFVLRDLIQMRYGKGVAYKSIFIALGLSFVTSFVLENALIVVTASFISFLVSESADAEIFSRLKKSVFQRVFISGFVGGVLDSAIFIIIALSPIGLNFISWEVLPYAILGQVIVKTLLQVIGAYAITIFRKGLT